MQEQPAIDVPALQAALDEARVSAAPRGDGITGTPSRGPAA